MYLQRNNIRTRQHFAKYVSSFTIVIKGNMNYSPRHLPITFTVFKYWLATKWTGWVTVWDWIHMYMYISIKGIQLHKCTKNMKLMKFGRIEDSNKAWERERMGVCWNWIDGGFVRGKRERERESGRNAFSSYLSPRLTATTRQSTNQKYWHY